MHTFMEKYSEHFEEKDAVKLIENEIDKAYKYCEKGKKEYLNHLATVHDMIEDYFKVKGYNRG